MITLGYCHICNCPVKAYSQDAGAMQKDCAHGYEYIVWFKAMLSKTSISWRKE